MTVGIMGAAAARFAWLLPSSVARGRIVYPVHVSEHRTYFTAMEDIEYAFSAFHTRITTCYAYQVETALFRTRIIACYAYLVETALFRTRITACYAYLVETAPRPRLGLCSAHS